MNPYQDVSLAPAERARDLLDRLTLREKVGQLNQRLYGFQSVQRSGDTLSINEETLAEIRHFGGLGTLYGLYRADPWSGRTQDNGITPELAAKAYNLVQRAVLEQSRFGIPALLSEECPHGHQALGGYLLPVNLAMGATFDPQLVEQAFAVCGRQLKSMGTDFALMSVLDMLRDPRWGRSEECYSEDPYLASRLAAAAVRGCRSAGVEVVAKHLCAQGETTGGVNASAARIGPRELREIHLPAVEAAVAAGARGFMAAYNEIDGVPCHANSWLLRDYLRDELGFAGIVMADGGAIDRLDLLTGDHRRSGALALASGVDISLWDTGFSLLDEAVERGEVSEDLVDEAVLRVLTLKFERGLFEHPFLPEDTAIQPFEISHYPQSLELARHSAVLLKNSDRLLPIRPENYPHVALIGPNADNLYNQLGDYTPPTMEGMTVRQGLAALLAGKADLSFAQGSDILTGSDRQIREAVDLAVGSDLVVLVLGGSSNRFGDVQFSDNGAAIVQGGLPMDCGEGVDAADLALPGRQMELAEAVLATGKPVIVIVIGGRPYAIEAIAEKAAAVLVSFYPGPWGGQALAEIVLGQTEPAGRLPATLPASASALPCYYNYKASYDAMRYHNNHKPRFTFGSGLSYTGFALDGAELTRRSDGGVAISGRLRNTGFRSGWAVPMLYLRRVTGAYTARVRELCAFEKLAIPVGQVGEFAFALDADALCQRDENGQSLPLGGRIELLLNEGGNTIWQTELELS